MELARLGLEEITKPEKESEPEPDPKTLSAEEKYARLEAEFVKDKEERKKKEVQQQIRTELEEAVNSFDMLKDPEYKDLIAGVKAEALARQSLEPRISLKQAMEQVVADRQKIVKIIDSKWEEKLKNGRLLDNSRAGIVRGATGVPQIDSEKTFTPEDVRKGESLKVLTELLNSQQGA